MSYVRYKVLNGTGDDKGCIDIFIANPIRLASSRLRTRSGHGARAVNIINIVLGPARCIIATGTCHYRVFLGTAAALII